MHPDFLLITPNLLLYFYLLLQQCLGHSWYLAVDMQLFLLSPLLLWPLWHWRRRAAAGVVLLVLLLFGCLFSIIMLNELRVFDRQG